MGSQYVKIFYGPYKSFHTTSHKPQRLRGTRDKLRKLGYRVDLIPVDYINYCLFVMIGHEIFRCDIQNLQFNTESDLDPVSQRAVEACLQASTKFKRARSHFWFWSLLEHRVFMPAEYTPKDHWLGEVNVKKYANCLDCANCCGIQVRKNTEDKVTEFDYEKIKNEIIFGYLNHPSFTINLNKMGSQYVKIFYGPYTSFHTTSHKPQRLRGIRDKLRKLGYRVDLIPVDYINYCLFEMSGHEIFRCNIQNLQFNTESDLDPISTRAVEACLAASEKFQRARSYFWFWSLLEGSVFKRSEYAPKDYWPFDVKLKKYASCLECVDCCGILARKNTEAKGNEVNYDKIKQEIIYAP